MKARVFQFTLPSSSIQSSTTIVTAASGLAALAALLAYLWTFAFASAVSKSTLAHAISHALRQAYWNSGCDRLSVKIRTETRKSTSEALFQNLCNVLTMEIVTYSETRANLKAIMDRVVNDHRPVAITRQRGKPVVMIDLDDWNAMQETMYLLSTPNNAKRLMESIAEADAGRVIEIDPETMLPL